MKYSIVIAADKSGSGKTTVTCGLIYVLKKRGLKVQSFKCGPDYIDPMFHREVLGVPSGNLDSFFVSEDMLQMLYNEKSAEADISITEGVMGYYDGLGGVSTQGSTWEIADYIDAPTVLVMDCKGASVSVAALLRGMLDFPETVGGYDSDEEKVGRRRDSGVKGVILNRVSPMFYERLKGVIEEACPEVRVLGYMPDMKDLAVPSRHLGLVTPGDMAGFNQWLVAVSEQLEKTVDIEALLEIGRAEVKNAEDNAEGSKASEWETLKLKSHARILIAQDEAFSFYYQENKELLKKMGAELVTFSPLHDEKLPEDIDGIILGGGYPELYGSALQANVSVRNEVSRLIKSGIPVIAECGGYMYLNDSIEASQGTSAGNVVGSVEDESGSVDNYQMCGVFSGKAVKKERLVRFGYVSVETKGAGLFGPAGTVLKGHEFHRYDCGFNGDGCSITKPAAGVGRARTKGRCYDGIYYSDTMAAGWPHFYYYSNPQAIFNFLKCCERYRIERLSQQKWDNIGKPIDSLGVLEKHVVKLCGIERTLTPSIERRALVVLCGDHGCVKEGVTQTDSSVTRKVADNFARGTMTTSFFARDSKADVYTIDVGMLGERYGGLQHRISVECNLDEGSRRLCSDNMSEKKTTRGYPELSMNTVNDRRLMDGTGNIAVESAMDRETGLKALELGREIVRELKEKGYEIIATGEMGIGNTTPTAALLAFFLGLKAEDTVGYGAGLSEEGLKRKREVVDRALKRLYRILDECETGSREITKAIAETALFEVGGLEIAVMAGMFLGACEYEVPMIIDGIISTAAALSAFMMDRRVAAYAFASHISGEKAAKLALDKMGLRAIIDAEMSLGEGSGAMLLLPILTSAVNVYNEMGTFSDIEVKKYQRLR